MTRFTKEAKTEKMRALAKKIGRAQAEGKNTGDLEAKLEDGAQEITLGEDPKEPTEQRYVTNDSIIEKLPELFIERIAGSKESDYQAPL